MAQQVDYPLEFLGAVAEDVYLVLGDMVIQFIDDRAQVMVRVYSNREQRLKGLNADERIPVKQIQIEKELFDRYLTTDILDPLKAAVYKLLAENPTPHGLKEMFDSGQPV